MPRLRQEPTVVWKLRLSARVAAPLEQLTMDPTLGKPRYGQRKDLIEGLILRYLREIGWDDAQTRIVDRRPLEDSDLTKLNHDKVERIYS